MIDNEKWLAGFREWRERQMSTADYYRQETEDAQLARDMAGNFTVQQMARLDVYRKAVAAGFYTDFPS